jgi:hypothetical protein
MLQKNPNEKIKKLEEELNSLREYLLSDCCRQCGYIVNKIEEYEKKIKKLTDEYIG